MKPLHICIPALLFVAAAALWFSKQTSEAVSLRNELESLRAPNTLRNVNPGDSNAHTQNSEEVAQLGRRLVGLRTGVAQEESETKAAEKLLAEIQGKIPPIAEGETIVSLGRITDMGKEAAQAIRGISALLAPPSESGIDREQVQASFMKMVTWMPEIAGFEERPAEMACFQAAILRELFGLDDSRARQMEGIIKIHFDAVHAAGLTAANSTQPNWRERRSAILTPLLWQLRPYIPPDFKSPDLVSQIVNVGAGFETTSETHLSKEPGKSSHSVSMKLPSWPRLPWLPVKPAAPQ